MALLQDLLQLIAGLGILNVWVLRFRKSTAYRGGHARNMTEEFAHYGLPDGSVYVVGFLKITAALGLLAGLRIESLILPASLLLAGLMAGAFLMHLKVADPLKKSVPAVFLLVVSIAIALL